MTVWAIHLELLNILIIIKPTFIQYTYSVFGRVLSSVAAGIAVSYNYDQMGRIVSEIDGMGYVALYQYDSISRGDQRNIS